VRILLGDQKVLFFCLPVTLLNDKLCANSITIKPLEFRNDFDVIGYEKVCFYTTRWRHYRMVRRALAEVCTVTVLLVFNFIVFFCMVLIVNK